MSEEKDQEDRELPNEKEIQEWYESQEEEENHGLPAVCTKSIEQRYAESQLRIVRSTMDFSLLHLRQSLTDSTYIDLSPLYQRRTRWDTKKKSRLIESFLMNIPVPAIYLFEREYSRYEVMDGRQRLGTIHDYLNDRFALKGMDFWKELEGFRFSELPDTIQRGLVRRTLSAIVLLAETSRPEDSDIDVRMVLFQRLNTGGETLNPQELRNALYPGIFNSMLHRISRSDLFTDAWRIPKAEPGEPQEISAKLAQNNLYITMTDCEIVLRFFAIRETLKEDLRGSLRTLLNKCMIRHCMDEQGTINDLEDMYLTCLKKCNLIFDGNPFVLPRTNKVSRPLYDALMVAISMHPEANFIDKKEPIQARLRQELEEPVSYDTLVGRANTVSAIQDRVHLAESILFLR